MIRWLATVLMGCACGAGAAINAPDSLSLVFNVNLTVTVTWRDNADNETGFLVDRRLAGGTWRTVGRTGADTTTFVDHNVQRDLLFHYRVRAYAGSDTSPYSALDSITETAKPVINLLSPTGGETWHVGDTVYIDFTTRYVMSVAIFMTANAGLDWVFMLPHRALRDDLAGWGHYPLEVPDWPSDSCIIEVKEYATDYAVYSGMLRVVRRPAAVAPAEGDARRFRPHGWRIEVLRDGPRQTAKIPGTTRFGLNGAYIAENACGRTRTPTVSGAGRR